MHKGQVNKQLFVYPPPHNTFNCGFGPFLLWMAKQRCIIKRDEGKGSFLFEMAAKKIHETRIYQLDAVQATDMVLAELDDPAELFQRQLDVILCVENLGISKVKDMVLWLKHEHLLHAESSLCIPGIREGKQGRKGKSRCISREKKGSVVVGHLCPVSLSKLGSQSASFRVVLCVPNLAWFPRGVWGKEKKIG